MKQIYEVLQKAWEVGIVVTEISLTPEQIKDIFLDITEGQIIKSLNTEFGEVRIVCT